MKENLRVFCDFTSSAATLSHETRFEYQKLRVFCDFTSSAVTLSHETEVRVSKTEGFLLRFDNFRGNSFERNEVAVTLSPCV